MTTCFCSVASQLSGRSLRLITGSLSFLVALSAAGAAQTNHYVDVTAQTGAQDGTDWANAFPYLENALLAAAPGDNIMLAEGVYRPGAATGGTSLAETFNITTRVQIFGGYKGFNGGIPGSETLPDKPDGSRFNTHLSGDIMGTPADLTDDVYHVVTVSVPDFDGATMLDGVQISNGNAVGLGVDESIGGGILVKDSWLRIADGFLRQNIASGNGAGVHISGTSILHMVRNRVRRNQSEADGAGIYAEGNTQVVLFNLDMSQNIARARGGALRFTSNSDGELLFSNSIIYDNRANLGGGISMDATSEGRDVINCTISFNQVTGDGAAGAGVHVDGHTETVQLLNSIVYFNPELANNDNVSAGDPSKFFINYSDVGNSVPVLPPTGFRLNLDPVFTNANTRRMGLGQTSPCLDAGNDHLLPDDVLDVDEDGSFPPETLDRDIVILGIGNGGQIIVSDRERSSTNCATFPGVDAAPFGRIVDMGAYEQEYICDGPML